MKVIFAGTPEFARVALERLLTAGFEVPLVLTQPDRPAGRGMKLQASPVKQCALEHGIAVAQPMSLRLDGKYPEEAAAAKAAIDAAQADVMVVAAYGLILPQWVLDTPRLGCLNIHASLLPRWRGAAPIHRAIEAGDAETGVTIMQMDAGLDTGDMSVIERLPIAADDTTASLQDKLGIEHAMVLMLDASAQQLYTVASCGYATSGVGSEIRLGQGVIGVAARERTPVRISHMTHAALYSHAIRESMDAHAAPDAPPLRGMDIPYPGLPEPHSQVAVPLLSAGRLLGVLFAESPEDMRFGFEDEDLLVAIAGQLAAAIDLLQAAPDTPEPLPAPTAAPPVSGSALRVRHFAANDSVFINDDYLIKGVAGAIVWRLLRDHQHTGRVDFTNRELRLDPALRLPDVADNLEARLLLLQRRLQENCPHIHIEKTGRGRFRLCVLRPVVLEDA